MTETLEPGDGPKRPEKPPLDIKPPTTDTTTRSARATEGIVVRERIPRQDSRDSYKALQRELLARLDHLRSEVREICDAHVENVDAEITTLTDFLEGSTEVRSPEDRKARTLKKWITVLDEMRIKPRKGRRKDLKRVDEAVRKLMNTAFE